jgi:hypothetical protein
MWKKELVMSEPRAGKPRAFSRALMIVAIGMLLLAPSVKAALKDGSSWRRPLEVTVSRHRLEPAILDATEGDHVVLTVRSAQAIRLAIKDLRVRVEVPKGGEPVTVEFDAPRAGSFDIALTEAGVSSAQGLKGQLQVVARRGR